MNKSPVLTAEQEFVVKKLSSLESICERCLADLHTFPDRCSADLSDPCPGFDAIENAKAEFHRERAEARTQEVPK